MTTRLFINLSQGYIPIYLQVSHQHIFNAILIPF